MAWVELRFTVLGEQQVARAFQASGRDAQDMSEPLGEIGEQLRQSVSEQFRTEGAHGLGRKWVQLNSSYARWKRQEVGEQPILVFHEAGGMRDTLTSRQAVTVTPQRMIYRPEGFHADVAAYHQAGAGNLPQRKVVALTELEKRGWERTFATWLRRDPLFHFN